MVDSWFRCATNSRQQLPNLYIFTFQIDPDALVLFHDAAARVRTIPLNWLAGARAACRSLSQPSTRTPPGVTNATTFLTKLRQKPRHHAFIKWPDLPDLKRFFSPHGMTRGWHELC
jgi:hypothetical protein